MNAILLFRGIQPEAVLDLFDCVSSLASPSFNKHTFLEIYLKAIGYYEEDNKKK